VSESPQQISISGPWLPALMLGFALLGVGAWLRWGLGIALVVVGAALIVLVFAAVTASMLIAVRVRRDRRPK
jgi:cytochrome c oxidase subunit IV